MINPFKALGDINAMRKQAMQIQAVLEQESFDIHEGNIHIAINGNQNVTLAEVDGVANEVLKRAMNSAIKRSQQAAAGKLAELSKGLNG